MKFGDAKLENRRRESVLEFELILPTISGHVAK
ncbi:hypothetical protein Dd1591_1226 [Dickeya chrysanthemi Ech1591]|uniref:Uncharacterized protein n=1 Tax=Dickeya chrysanthemi (strain Ech1591) TaxID=561229 RepID=C6CQ97_DICC1|nr:hypothetical protein Dd1591_1226 [Dickeya chrysanthemi Ech1591]